MKRKLFSAILFGALLVTSTSGLTSCKDYDDDIQNLQTQIDANSAAIKAIQDKIAAGVILKSVNPISNGIEVVLENGTSYKITNGEPGAQGPQGPQGPQGETGKAGSVVTMGDNGNWFIDGVDTGKPWKGKDGVSTGVSGTFWAIDLDNPETPKLVKWVDGVKTNETFEIPTDDDCVSAVWDTEKQVLTLVNVIESVGEEPMNIEISLAAQLTSLVFVPESYIHGIEAIKFVTLQYQDWGTDPEKWLADEADEDNEEYSIADATTTVEYLVNPTNVSLDDIEELSYISNEATDVRSASPEAPILVAGKTLGKNEKGATVLTLNLQKKKPEVSLIPEDPQGVGLFTIVALKAVVKQKSSESTPSEVYSDWARLDESTATPYIHYAEAEDETDANAHFWNFSTAYDDNETVDAEIDADQDGKCVIKEVAYDKEIDLMDLVEVRDHAGNKYDTESYGLKFEFNLLDYKLKNEGSTSDATNQKQFAKLDGTKLVSTARDNTTTKNRDAIGRQPMIQVVLKDVNDPANVKVVDVRYFKIKWIDKIVYENYGDLAEFEETYKCGEEITSTILEEKVNAIYTRYNMSEREFFNSYTLDENLYATLDDAKNGTQIETELGTLAWKQDAENSNALTHNIAWKYDTSDELMKMTQEEYEAGKKVVEAYGCFKSASNDNSKIIFKVKTTLKLDKMALKATHDATMWKDGARFVNPQLESDGTYGKPTYATTMILGDLRKGYIDNGQTPATVNAIVNYGVAKFVFDEDKLEALAAATGTEAEKWTISEDGTKLKYDGKVAAVIEGYKISLKENNNGAANSKPTDAAKLLVGHYAPIKLKDSYCDLTQLIEAYNVKFLTPLAFSASTIETSLSDITGGGSESTSIAGKIIIKEAFTTNKRVVYNNDVNPEEDLAPVPGLAAWYGLNTTTPVVFDITNAKTNIKTDGSIGSTCETKLSDIKNSDRSAKYTVEMSTDNDKVVFHNMSGNAIGQSFKIEIPVKVATKWQTLVGKIVVTVNPAI